MVRHNLYDIDLENKTAFCCACGPTEVHVAKSRTELSPKVVCLKRWEDLLQEAKQKRDEKRRLKPGWKPRHSLSEINAEKMTAICAVCGWTDIQKNSRKESIYYICATKVRPYMRNYHRSRYAPRRVNPTAHRLSNIDEEKKIADCSRCGPVEIYIWKGKRNFRRRCSNDSVKGLEEAPQIRREINKAIIDEYKVVHGCRRCGYNINPNKLHLHSPSRYKKDPATEKLLGLTRARLLEELKICEIRCETCQSLQPNEFKKARRGSELPPRFSYL